eukprot:6940436-Pyramimonas_sp.AAC.1
MGVGAHLAEFWLNRAEAVSQPKSSLRGPGGLPPQFNAVDFLESCKTQCPGTTLSVGWTVGKQSVPVIILGQGGYKAKHIAQALDDLKRTGMSV